MKTKAKTDSERLEELLKAFLTSNGNSSFSSRVILHTQFKTIDNNGKHAAHLLLHGHKIATLCDGEVLMLFPCYHVSSGKISNLTFKRLSLLNKLAREYGISDSSLSRNNGLLIRHNGGHTFALRPSHFPAPKDCYFVV